MIELRYGDEEKIPNVYKYMNHMVLILKYRYEVLASGVAEDLLKKIDEIPKVLTDILSV